MVDGSEKATGHKTLLQYSSLTPLERECYEGEVQPYRKRDYKLIIISILFIYYHNNIIHTYMHKLETYLVQNPGGRGQKVVKMTVLTEVCEPSGV